MTPDELAKLKAAYEDDSIDYPDIVIADQLNIRLREIQLAAVPFVTARNKRQAAYRRAIAVSQTKDDTARLRQSLARGMPEHPKHYCRPVACPNCAHVFTVPADPRVKPDHGIP